MKKLNQQGIAHHLLIIFLAVAIVAAVGFAGYKVFNNKKGTEAKAYSWTLLASPNGPTGTFAVYGCYTTGYMGIKQYKYYVMNDIRTYGNNKPMNLKITNYSPYGIFYVSKYSTKSQIISSTNLRFKVQGDSTGVYAGGYDWNYATSFTQKARAC